VPAVTLGEKAKRGAQMGEGVHEGLEPGSAASVRTDLELLGERGAFFLRRDEGSARGG
jgi:phosphate uptake regulator